MTASKMRPDRNLNNAKEDRKLRKPLIEKRRRERINCSLEQLKGIMVDAYNLDHSKLEKADVLEVTVQHMEGLQKGHTPGSVAGFESRQRYSSGYIQCMHEVHNLLLSCPGMDKSLGARLLNHLLKSLPHLSADTGSPGSAGDPDSPGGGCGSGGRNAGSLRSSGSRNGATSNATSHRSGGNAMSGGGSAGCRGSDAGCCGDNIHPPPLPPRLVSSPPSSPLSTPARAALRPRRLQLAEQQPAASVPLIKAAGWVTEGSDVSPSSSSSPSLPPTSPPPSPVFMSAGDSSMWRPW